MMKFVDHLSELTRLVPCENMHAKIFEVEGRIIDSVPRSRREAGAIIAVASTWVLADLDPEMIERAHSAMKRVAAYLSGLPAPAAEYYGIWTTPTARAA